MLGLKGKLKTMKIEAMEFPGVSRVTRVGRWAQPITFLNIHECDTFTDILLEMIFNSFGLQDCNLCAPMAYEQHLEYDLESMEGEFNSFEREVYDLSRTVMLKYSMQVRLGRMNGVLVAYHNTNRFFGFEYISLERMDEILVGDTRTANRLFDISFKLLERTLTEILNDFSSEPAMKLTFRAPAKMPGSLQVFVELDPPAIEQLSEQDLIAKLNEFGVSMPGASVGALLTRYDECLREEDPAFKQTYEILPLYEKAAQGKLFLYEMFATHLVNGHDIQHRHELLNLKSARKDLTTVYQFGPHHEQGPLSVAREYWYALKEGERPESNEPKLFMYPDKGYKR